MKWVHVFGNFDRGGAELRTLRFIEQLGDLHEHVVVSLDGSRGALDSVAEVPPQLRWQSAPAGVVGSTLRTARAVAALVGRERPDALITYGWSTFDVVLWSATLGRRIPCVHHEDGFTAEELRAIPKRRIRARRFALPRIAATIVPSKSLAAVARDVWRVPEMRIEVVPNGVAPVGTLAPLDRTLLGPGAAGRAVCVVVCRLVEVKRIELALEVARRADVHLVVVGDGPERDRLEERARALDGLSVHFAGMRDDVRRWLRAADLYLSTSQSEQHPIAMLEAMDEGLAVVATDVGDVARTLPEEQLPFLVPQEGPVEALAAAVRGLAAAPDKRAELGRRNKARIDDRYRAREAAHAWEEAISRRVTSGLARPGLI